MPIEIQNSVTPAPIRTALDALKAMKALELSTLGQPMDAAIKCEISIRCENILRSYVDNVGFGMQPALQERPCIKVDVVDSGYNVLLAEAGNYYTSQLFDHIEGQAALELDQQQQAGE